MDNHHVLVGKLTHIFMAMLNSYVKLPEGMGNVLDDLMIYLWAKIRVCFANYMTGRIQFRS